MDKFTVVRQPDPRRDDRLVFSVSGTLDLPNALRFSGQVWAVVAKVPFRQVVLDLTWTTLGDYREVLVFQLACRLKNSGAVLTVRNPPRGLVDYWSSFGIPDPAEHFGFRVTTSGLLHKAMRWSARAS